MSMQVSVLVVIVGILDRLLARWAWPQLRAALWLLVLAKLVLPPSLSSPVSVSRLGMLPTAHPTGSMVPTVFFWIWVAGVLVLGGLGAWRYARLQREWLAAGVAPDPFVTSLGREVALRLGLRRLPRLVVQQGVTSPAVVGFLRPVVVLPAKLVLGSRESLEHVLFHEMAHVRRKDPLVALACLLLQLCYWFHPAVWWARHRLASLRELCCDQTVASILLDATPRYRRTLLELSRPLIGDPAPALGAGGLAFIHRHSQLLARLAWLERPLPRRPFPRRVATVLLCASMLACCIPLGPPAPTAATAARASLDNLRGCMQLRFAVFRALAEEERRLTKN